MDLKNKVVVVTGASRGMGAAFAEVLAAQGARLALCARSSTELAAEQALIAAKGGECFAAAADVTRPAQVRAFIARVMKKYGRIDVLVNNAGAVHRKQPIESITDEEYEACMRPNVDGVFYFTRAVLPVMKQQNAGVVVNVSSAAGKLAHAGLSVYYASKFAVEGFTQAVAKELEGTNVQCIALCPGGVNTHMREMLFGKEDAAKQQSADAVAEILRDILLGKIVVPNGADVRIRNGVVTGIDDVLHA